MPRKLKIRLDHDEQLYPVSAHLPASVISMVNDLARRSLVSRAVWIRQAIVGRLTAEGRVISDDDAVSVEAAA